MEDVESFFFDYIFTTEIENIDKKEMIPWTVFSIANASLKSYIISGMLQDINNGCKHCNQIFQKVGCEL